jgi:NhaA family Na+:H+ antiporter
LIIAIFYTGDISVTYLGAAAIVLAALVAMNQFGVLQLWPYLVLGMLLWFLVLGSGIHATVAGVLLALTIPLRASRGRPDEMAGSPLHRLEHKLQGWVAFGIVPIFGFANAGVSFEGLTINSLLDPLTLGVALGLLIGKVAGVFGSAYAVIRAGFADVPMGAGFIGLLAFANDPLIQEEVKLGILLGSTLSGLGGWTLLRFAPRQVPSPQSTPAR